MLKESLQLNIVKHDELLSLVNGYITMNQFDTFYEKIESGYKVVSSTDLVYLIVKFKKGISSYCCEYWIWGKYS